MSNLFTPRSRTPSRASTPIPGPSPSRLAPPVVQPVPSISNLRRVSSHGQGASSSALQTPISTSPPSASMSASSSASSAINAEGPSTLFLPEFESDADTIDGEQASITGRDESRALDEESRKNLREQLRQTLNKKESHGDFATITRRRRRKGKEPEMVETPSNIAVDYPPRQYFVLTDAGKPVFVSRQQDEDSDSFTSTIGITQALVSVFLDDGDRIRCINAGNTRITFLLRPPLYYVCVSSWGEPESVTRFHLEYLHLQILSVISAEQLRRMFERRKAFDLRRLLSGAEPLLHSLLGRMEWDIAMSTSSLYCLRLDPTLRKSVADALVPTLKIKDILYVILLARERVITLVRPKRHSIHPSDLHILINTLHSPSIINNSASASWFPVCLPKFNSAAFVNAYATFLKREGNDSGAGEAREDSPRPDGQESCSVQGGDRTSNDSGSSSGASRDKDKTSSQIGLVCVSGAADLDVIRNWCEAVSKKLQRDGLLDAIFNSISSGQTEYVVSDLRIPGLRHFVYKSRGHIQVTMPTFEEPYDNLDERRRLITLYQTLYDGIHAKSGQGSTLKLQYMRTQHESVMGWITQPFELYIALSPLLPKSAVVSAANAVARWVQKEESRLFLRNAPTF